MPGAPQLLLLVTAAWSAQIEDSKADLHVGSGQTVRVVVELGADGESVFSGRSDGLVARWSLSTGKRRSTYGSGDRPFRCFAPSPSGADVALGFEHGIVQIWRADVGEPTRSFAAHDSAVSRVVWSPDARYLVTFGQQREMCVWETGSGRRIARQTSAEPYGVRACAVFTRDSRRLAFAIGERVVRWLDLQRPERVHELAGNYGGVTSLSFDPDGRRLAVTTERGEDESGWCHVWSLEAGARLARFGRELGGEMDPIALTRFSEDGRTIVSLDIFGQLETRETDAFGLLSSTSLGGGGWPSPFISGDLDVGVGLAVWSGYEPQTNVFSLGEQRSVGTIVCDPKSVIRIDPSGRFVVTNRDHLVRVFDAATCSPCWTRVEYQEGEWLCISSDLRFFGTPKAEVWARVRVCDQRQFANLEPAMRDPDSVRRAMSR